MLASKLARLIKQANGAVIKLHDPLMLERMLSAVDEIDDAATRVCYLKLDAELNNTASIAGDLAKRKTAIRAKKVTLNALHPNKNALLRTHAAR